MGKEARESLSADFIPERVAGDTEELYAQLILTKEPRYVN